MKDDLVLYFGCKEQPGHFLISPDHRSIDRNKAHKLAVPSAEELDCSPLFLPRKEKVGTGALTYLPAPDRTILAWWGNPWDSRGKVNTAIIVSGNASADECWQRFSAAFPALSLKLEKPAIEIGGANAS